MKEFEDILLERFSEGVPSPSATFCLPCSPTSRASPSTSALILRFPKGSLERYGRGGLLHSSAGAFRKVPCPLNLSLSASSSHAATKCSGITRACLENQAGLSEQVPAVLEITTNASSKGVRSLGPAGGWKDVVIRKPRCEVTAENVDVLRFLDAVSAISPKNGQGGTSQLQGLARKAGRDRAFAYADYYPAKTSKRLIESEALGVFA